MDARFWPMAALIILAAALSGCSSSTDDQEIFSDAVAAMEEARSERDSYVSVLESYGEAKKGIDLVLSEYENSATSTALRSGDMDIAGLSLEEFLALEFPLELHAGAEQEPLSNALLVAGSVQRVADKDRVLAEIAVERAESGDLVAAEATLQEITGPVDKHWALVWIAGAYASDGQSEKAEALFGDAREIIEGIERPAERGWMLTEISGRYTDAGYEQEARESLDRARLDAESVEGREKAWLLAEIGGKYARVGETGQAELLFAEALETATAFENKLEQLQAILWFADRQLDYGMHERAGDLLSQAEDSLGEAVEESEPAEQIGMVVQLAEAYGRLGDKEAASQLLERARRASGVLASDYQSAWALAVTARHYAELAQYEEATELLEEARARVDGIEGSANRDGVLTDIAIGYAQVGRVAEGLRVAESILGNYDQAWALTRIAAIHEASGETPDEDMRASLRRLTHKHRPMDSFWD